MKKLFLTLLAVFALLGVARADDKAYQKIYVMKVCSNNLKQIGVALMMFNVDRKMLPAADGADGLEQIRSAGFLDIPDSYVCPGDTNRTVAAAHTPITEKNCSYVYFGGIDINKVRSPGRMPLAFDKPGIRHEGVTGILFIDGHVEKFPGEFNSATELIETLIIRGGLDAQADFLRQKAKAADKRLQSESAAK